jgi:hypothetical protein
VLSKIDKDQRLTSDDKIATKRNAVMNLKVAFDELMTYLEMEELNNQKGIQPTKHAQKKFGGGWA